MRIDSGDIAFVRVLGPIQVVTTSGSALDLPSASQRRLLARLAVDAPRALRVDLLCDVLAISPGALRTIVSRLRRGFGDTTVALDIPERERADLLVRLGYAQQQADDPGALATLTEAAALARGCGATAIVAQAALATDRGFLRLGPTAPAQILAIIEPYAGEVATNLGPVAAYAGRLASLLGRHDAAEQHLNAALGIADAFGWDYHRATILIARAAGRRRSLGTLDGPARASLALAEDICVARDAGHARRDR